MINFKFAGPAQPETLTTSDIAQAMGGESQDSMRVATVYGEVHVSYRPLSSKERILLGLDTRVQQPSLAMHLECIRERYLGAGRIEREHIVIEALGGEHLSGQAYLESTETFVSLPIAHCVEIQQTVYQALREKSAI